MSAEEYLICAATSMDVRRAESPSRLKCHLLPSRLASHNLFSVRRCVSLEFHIPFRAYQNRPLSDLVSSTPSTTIFHLSPSW